MGTAAPTLGGDMHSPVPTSPSLLAILGLLMLAGCDADPSAPHAEERVLTAAQVPVPHSMELTGVGVFQGQTLAPDFGPPAFGRSLFDGRCTVPSDVVISFTLSGQASHLGTYTAALEHCLQVDFATGLSAISDGVATFTAANGDELWDRYQRVVPGSGSRGDPESHVFVGGTGRFEAASGEAWLIARCDRSSGLCDVELQGELTYDASDRRR
jgi:hypothetical protein